PDRIVMKDRLCHPISCNHIGNGIFFWAVRGKHRVLQHLGDSLSQLTDLPDLLRFVGMEVPVDDSFLWMPKSIRFSDWDHFVDLVDVEIASCAIIVFEQGHYRFIPSLEYARFSGVGRVKVDPGFCSTDGRS